MNARPMTYEAWRLSFQSAEQAARYAYAEIMRLHALINAHDNLQLAKLAKAKQFEGAGQ